jgi:uncharacterized protein YukE
MPSSERIKMEPEGVVASAGQLHGCHEEMARRHEGAQTVAAAASPGLVGDSAAAFALKTTGWADFSSQMSSLIAAHAEVLHQAARAVPATDRWSANRIDRASAPRLQL